jgi:tyrosyl-tRNA synthetase
MNPQESEVLETIEETTGYAPPPPGSRAEDRTELQATSEAHLEAEAALAILERGCDGIISREELKHKLMRARAENRPLRVKLGLDPTAPDIHLGFAVVLKKLRAFQDLGHHAHLIIGDFTAMIGDPTGKSKTRPQLSREQVRDNARTYQEQLFRILDEDKTTVHFNGDWLGDMTFPQVIQLAAKYTVAQTLEREDFSKRLSEGRPIGLHEILYPLCQGQDSVEIKADVELGGSDQRFNNLVGRELQRADGQEAQVVMLLPLLVGTDGTQKMSKSLGNTIGVTDPAAEMFGKAMSIPDHAMRQYFTLATFVPLDEVDALLAGHPMVAKKRLAWEIAAQYHGSAAADAAREDFEKKFVRHETPDEMPEVSIPSGEIGVLDLIRAAFGGSGSEARRLVQGGAVALDDQKIEDERARVSPSEGAVLRAGKRKWARVKISG